MRGLYTPLMVMFPSLPIYVEVVLLPFRDVIITDGLMTSPPMQISGRRQLHSPVVLPHGETLL